ncbi:hypothetical protein [Streptomyces humidus]|uniref:hypothetical protein n=1 Tax=Streptomyces humidus TaxID=52259 RepID=UPI0033185C0C
MPAPAHRWSLRSRRVLVVTAAAAVAAGTGAGVVVVNAGAGTVGLCHRTLAAKDGRAFSGTGTTGGARADAAHTDHDKTTLKTTVNGTPTLTTGLETSAKNLPTTLATTTGAGVLK